MKFSINCMRLRKLFEKINRLTDECILDFKPTGLKAEVVDMGMACVGIFNISRDDFISYDSISKGVLCGIDVPKILSVLKRINGQENVNFEMTESKIKIKQGDREFMLSQIEVEKEELPPLKDLEFDVKIKFSSQEYRRCLKDATIFGEEGNMVFDSDGNMLKMSAKDNVDSWKAEYKKGKKEDYMFSLKSIKGIGKSSYSLDFLTKSKPKSDWGIDMDMKWKTESPIEIKYEEDGIKNRYIIAPQILGDE